jgi:hypothetical protein
MLRQSGAFVNEESPGGLTGQFECGFGDPKPNLPVNKRDLSTRENGEKLPDSAQQEAFNVALTGFSVEAGEPPELQRTFGMLGIRVEKLTGGACQQNTGVSSYFEVVAPQKHGFRTFSLRIP